MLTQGRPAQTIGWLLLVLVGLPAWALADDAKPDQPETIKLTLHPALPPAAALHYPLLPKYLDRTPGNAALIYLKALSLKAENRPANEFWEQVDKWLHMPPAELPQAEVGKALDQYRFVLDLVRIAARREHCDWDPPLRESPNPYMILLPEMQSLRTLAQIVALQARLQIAEGKFPEALDTLSTGYSLARNSAECPFLVCGLIGIAIEGMMDDQLQTLIQSPNCPNLYWSLTALPDPLIDLRPAGEVEQATLDIFLPELRDVEHAQRSPEQWKAALTSMIERLMELNRLTEGTSLAGPNGASVKDEAATLAQAVEVAFAYPKAKAGLLAAGREKKEVEAMPPAQVILIYMALTHERLSDEMFKWYNVPYPQARTGARQVEQRMGSEYRRQEIVPLTSMIVPAILAIKRADARGQRRIAALRVLEAMRLYAAEHDGKLPAALDDIKDVPIPLDPVSDKPFGYQRTADNKAVLEGRPPEGEWWVQLGLRYEIEMTAAKKK